MKPEDILNGILSVTKEDVEKASPHARASFSTALKEVEEALKDLPEGERDGIEPTTFALLRLLDEIEDAAGEFKKIIREDEYAVMAVPPATRIMRANDKIQKIMLAMAIMQTGRLAKSILGLKL